ncbi:hypothetical protein J6S88_01935 [bacterium]|nr:hypothetical protein [bacterium]
MSNNIVFSKITNIDIPITVKPKRYEDSIIGKMVEYDIYDGRKMIGYGRILDKDYGCYVPLIQSYQPDSYGKLGSLFDKLEVQYCLEKGMNDFEIRSFGAMNSHAIHYLRGKRFEGEATPQQIKRFRELFKWARLKSFDYNTIVKYIIDHTPKDERFNTKFLSNIPMYMPKELIQKYAAELLKNPIIIK